MAAKDNLGSKLNGTLGLPHYNNSRASSAMYEPLWRNLFWVQIALPAGVAAGEDETNLLLEEVQKVGGLDTNMVPGVTEQGYKFATRSYANAGPEKTTLVVTLDFNVNLAWTESNPVDNYVIKTLRKWTDLIWDPLTGKMGLKRDYVADYVVITLHDKALNPYWQWTLYDVFPITKGIGPIDLDYSQKNQIVQVQGFTLRCDHWDEVQL